MCDFYIDEFTVEQAIEQLGFGRFQLKMAVIISVLSVRKFTILLGLVLHSLTWPFILLRHFLTYLYEVFNPNRAKS